MSLKVHFENIEEGNLQVMLKSERQTLIFIASYIPYNSFLELVDSLIAVLNQKKINTTARWNTEPVEYEFQFSGSTENLFFVVKEYPDSRRKINNEGLVFNITGSSFEIATSFWQALRHVQGHFDAISKWKHSFPDREMSILNELFSNYSVAPQPFERHE